ncbi:MAG TPA: hypothetical protein PLA88_04565 [Bacteroidales bacterium]|nr:hypothetical protein [Bacteroidales bacterium]
MTTPIIITKSTKSVGIAILLTFLFGPIGLFYASVIGGLIMTFMPIFLTVLSLVGLAQKNSSLFGWSFGILVVFSLTYWLINIIWAVISVSKYNRKIEEDAKKQVAMWNSYNHPNPNQFETNINQKVYGVKTSMQEQIKVSTKPNLKDWLRDNPGNTINDYFMKFGR